MRNIISLLLFILHVSGDSFAVFYDDSLASTINISVISISSSGNIDNEGGWLGQRELISSYGEMYISCFIVADASVVPGGIGVYGWTGDNSDIPVKRSGNVATFWGTSYPVRGLA